MPGSTKFWLTHLPVLHWEHLCQVRGGQKGSNGESVLLCDCICMFILLSYFVIPLPLIMQIKQGINLHVTVCVYYFNHALFSHRKQILPQWSIYVFWDFDSKNTWNNKLLRCFSEGMLKLSHGGVVLDFTINLLCAALNKWVQLKVFAWLIIFPHLIQCSHWLIESSN